MRLEGAWIVARREYRTRVTSKAFWLGTVAIPLLMGLWLVLPGLVLSTTRSRLSVAVLDETGRLGERVERRLAESSERAAQQVRFEVELVPPVGDGEEQAAALDRRVRQGEIGAWLRLSEEGLAAGRVEYRAESVSSFLTQQVLQGAVSAAVRELRFEEAGLDANRIQELSREVSLDTVRLTAAGSTAEGAAGGFFLAIALFALLYTSIMIYGTQIMLAVLEEKGTRVVEVLLAAVRPLELMVGKLAGVCGAALTQIVLWMAALLVLTAPGLALSAALPEAARLPRVPLAVAVHFLLFFLLGFVVFAAFYAILGAAFNNQQEAQQASFVGVIFFVAPWIVLMPVINDPDSPLAVGMSLVPVFTPLIMLLRIAVKMPPAWQLLLGYALTAGLCVAMVWFAARVYRVGILMYGKKPTFGEIWRWVRYG